jgi:hypothetical protein
LISDLLDGDVLPETTTAFLELLDKEGYSYPSVCASFYANQLMLSDLGRSSTMKPYWDTYKEKKRIHKQFTARLERNFVSNYS